MHQDPPDKLLRPVQSDAFRRNPCSTSRWPSDLTPPTGPAEFPCDQRGGYLFSQSRLGAGAEIVPSLGVVEAANPTAAKKIGEIAKGWWRSRREQCGGFSPATLDGDRPWPRALPQVRRSQVDYRHISAVTSASLNANGASRRPHRVPTLKTGPSGRRLPRSSIRPHATPTESSERTDTGPTTIRLLNGYALTLRPMFAFGSCGEHLNRRSFD